MRRIAYIIATVIAATTAHAEVTSAESAKIMAMGALSEAVVAERYCGMKGQVDLAHVLIALEFPNALSADDAPAMQTVGLIVLAQYTAKGKAKWCGEYRAAVGGK